MSRRCHNPDWCFFVQRVSLAYARSFASAQECDVQVWPTTLPWLLEVEELSKLATWLLEPDVDRLPTVWQRLATRSATEVDPRTFCDWSLSIDQELVKYAEAAHSSSGSLLNLRSSQLASLPEQQGQKFTLLEGTAPAVRCFRFGLLQRFNQLVHKFLPLVHTGNSHEGRSLGGRICLLRAVIFMEVKQSTLEQVRTRGGRGVSGGGGHTLHWRWQPCSHGAGLHGAGMHGAGMDGADSPLPIRIGAGVDTLLDRCGCHVGEPQPFPCSKAA